MAIIEAEFESSASLNVRVALVIRLPETFNFWSMTVGATTEATTGVSTEAKLLAITSSVSLATTEARSSMTPGAPGTSATVTEATALTARLPKWTVRTLPASV